jgi:hypothetical protein
MALSPFGKLVAAVENTAAILLFAVTVISFAAVSAHDTSSTRASPTPRREPIPVGRSDFLGTGKRVSPRGAYHDDAAWTLSPRRLLKHMLDIIANAIICAALAVFLWQFSERLLDTCGLWHRHDRLDLPVAAFFLLA